MEKKFQISDEQIKFVKKVALIQSKIDKIKKGSNVLIFGAGVHTHYLLECCVLSGYNLKICDSYKEGKINTYSILRPCKKIYEWADSIIISCFRNRREIIELLKSYQNKLVVLYEESDKEPFFQHTEDLDINNIKNICKTEEALHIDKYGIWKAEGSGESYEADVEKNFFNRVTKKIYLKYVQEGNKVLDVGAGTGRLSVELFDYGCIVSAVDTSADMLNIINKKRAQIETIVVNSELLPFENETFDRVVSCDAMVHFLNWRQFLNEHYRVLKKNGYIIFNMYNDEHLKILSGNRFLRSSYIASGSGIYATISREELESYCKEKEDLDLIDIIPYNFFAQSAFSYGLLTRLEMQKLGWEYNLLCSNKNIGDVVEKFEEEIVQKLPETMTACNICVLKKG